MEAGLIAECCVQASFEHVWTFDRVTGLNLPLIETHHKASHRVSYSPPPGKNIPWGYLPTEPYINGQYTTRASICEISLCTARGVNTRPLLHVRC
jgi:hypothetical protein